MKVAGVREVKNRLSEYLRLVRAGEEILITDRGEVVAELRQPDKSALDEYPAGLMEVAREGKVSLGGKNDPGLYKAMKRLVPRALSAKMLSEERGDR